MSDKYFDFESDLYDRYQGNSSHMVRCEELAPSGHELLFRFLSYDLSPFDFLVQGYTFDLLEGNIEGEPRLDGEDGLYREAEKIHPFFKNREHARGLILRTILEWASDQDLVQKAMDALSASPSFEQEKQYWAGQVSYCRGSVSTLRDIQYKIRTAIITLLDESASFLSSMTKEAREAVYTALYSGGKGPEKVSMTIELDFSPSPKVRHLQETNSFSGIYYINELFSENPPAKLIPILDSLRDEKASSVSLTYKVQTLEDILYMELYDMLREGTRIARCKACGRFFVIDAENADYCTIEEDGKSCLRTYREGVTKEMYWKAYKTHNQRLSRGRCTEEEFRAWKAEASAAREDVLQRRITMAEYEMILKK